MERERDGYPRNKGGKIMTGESIFVMILGMLIIWGGLAASIVYAMRKAKETK